MKKMLRTLTLLVAAATAFAACNSVVGGSAMDTPQTTAKIAETLKQIDTATWKIYELVWMEGESLENNLSSLRVEMVNRDGGRFWQSFTLGGPGAGTITDLRESIGQGEPAFESTHGITATMIDPETIQQQYEAAKAMLPEGYTFKSVGKYTIAETVPTGNPFLDRGKEIGAIRASFTLNVTEDGKEIVESAGKKSIQYYQIDFNVLPDGSVEIDE